MFEITTSKADAILLPWLHGVSFCRLKNLPQNN